MIHCGKLFIRSERKTHIGNKNKNWKSIEEKDKTVSQKRD